MGHSMWFLDFGRAYILKFGGHQMNWSQVPTRQDTEVPDIFTSNQGANFPASGHSGQQIPFLGSSPKRKRHQTGISKGFSFAFLQRDTGIYPAAEGQNGSELRTLASFLWSCVERLPAAVPSRQVRPLEPRLVPHVEVPVRGKQGQFY